MKKPLKTAKSQKCYKKINQSQILYHIVKLFKLGAASFCKNFTQNYFKKCLLHLFCMFLFSKIMFLH